MVNVQLLVQHQLIGYRAWFFELRVVQTVVLLWVVHQVVVRRLACVGHFFVQQGLERRLSQHIENRKFRRGDDITIVKRMSWTFERAGQDPVR